LKENKGTNKLVWSTAIVQRGKGLGGERRNTKKRERPGKSEPIPKGKKQNAGKPGEARILNPDDIHETVCQTTTGGIERRRKSRSLRGGKE